jgi:hypothetical protein
MLFLSLIFCKQEEKLLFFGSVSGYKKNRDKFSSIKEQAFNFMWDGINWKKGINILLTNN